MSPEYSMNQKLYWNMEFTYNNLIELCTLAFIWIAAKFVLYETNIISVFTLRSSLKHIPILYAVSRSTKSPTESFAFMSVPDTVNMSTCWFVSASFSTIFRRTKTNFWKWKSIIRFLHSSLFSTRISLTLDNTWMENATQSRLVEGICNTFRKRLTFELVIKFLHFR